MKIQKNTTFGLQILHILAKFRYTPHAEQWPVHIFIQSYFIGAAFGTRDAIYIAPVALRYVYGLSICSLWEIFFYLLVLGPLTHLHLLTPDASSPPRILLPRLARPALSPPPPPMDLRPCLLRLVVLPLCEPTVVPASSAAAARPCLHLRPSLAFHRRPSSWPPIP